MASCPQLTIRNQPPDFIARSLNGINTQHLTTYSLSEGKGNPCFQFRTSLRELRAYSIIC